MKSYVRKTVALLLLMLFSVSANAADIPKYTGEPYAVVNNNVPYFQVPHIDGEAVYETVEIYSELDGKGRCGPALAAVCTELMPTSGRESIGGVIPTGWHSVKYDFISGKYLYNRCHLIGRQLAGEDANPLNLITGTRHMNITGMLPFENMVADYVKETGNHVLYRVTPFFDGDDLVAKGVYMEAWSVEDNGEGVCYNVFCYNIQPGVVIDYSTGNSGAEGEYPVELDARRFHKPNCVMLDGMKEENIGFFEGAVWELIKLGFEPCGLCEPEE